MLLTDSGRAIQLMWKGAEAWASPSWFLLDKTRRLYWRGEAYMEGRYREFLR